MHEKTASLLQRLDQSIALMTELRRPDSGSTAAFDALKQARALVARALAAEDRVINRGPAAAPERAAA